MAGTPKKILEKPHLASGNPATIPATNVKNPKGRGIYETLNQSSIDFFKIQEAHAFPCLCVWVLFIAIIAIWTFYQFIKQGEGFLTFVVVAVVLFLLAISFYADWQYVKSKNTESVILFWKPWIAACLFPVVLFFAIIGQYSVSNKYERQLIATTNSFEGIIKPLRNELNDAQKWHSIYDEAKERQVNKVDDLERVIAKNASSNVIIANALIGTSNELAKLKNPYYSPNFLGDLAYSQYTNGDYADSAHSIELCFAELKRLQRTDFSKSGMSVIYLVDCYTTNRTKAGEKQFEDALNKLTADNISSFIDARDEVIYLDWVKPYAPTNLVPFIDENRKKAWGFFIRLSPD